MSFDFDSLLSEEQTDLDAFRRVTRDTSIYKPKADEGKDGVYKSVIKFIPWYKNKQKSIVQKWSTWLVDPTTNQGKTIDCPSSVGKPSDLYKMWRKLKDSEDISKQEQAEKFSRRLYCYALVQIVKDDNNPDLVGKIMVYKFGKKVKDMIESEINPEIGSPKDPFNILNGRRFVLHIKKNGKWDDPSSSKFDGESYPYLQINGEKVDISESMKYSEKKKMIGEWLEANSPNLEEFEFKDWDDETTKFVSNVIRYTEGGSSSQAIQDVMDEFGPKPKQLKPTPKASQKVTNVQDILDDDVPALPKKRNIVDDDMDDDIKLDDINIYE